MVENSFGSAVLLRVKHLGHLVPAGRVQQQAHHSSFGAFVVIHADVAAQEEGVVQKGGSLQADDAVVFGA